MSRLFTDREDEAMVRMTTAGGLAVGLFLLFVGSAQAADEASAATGVSSQVQPETQATPVAGQAALQVPQGPGPAPGPGLATPGAVSYAPMLPTSAAQATNP